MSVEGVLLSGRKLYFSHFTADVLIRSARFPAISLSIFGITISTFERRLCNKYERNVDRLFALNIHSRAA